MSWETQWPRWADASLQPNPVPEGSVKAPSLPAVLASWGATPPMLLQSADASRD